MLVLSLKGAHPVRQQPRSSRIPLTRDPITDEAANVVNRVSPAATKAADSFPHGPGLHQNPGTWSGYKRVQCHKGARTLLYYSHLQKRCRLVKG